MRHGLTIRGDSFYCPLSFSLDSYWNCENNCLHCYFRRLNHVWGSDLRPIKPNELRRKLINGLKNTNPISDLAWAIKQKKTLRFGNKSDPFQHRAEKELGISKKVLEILIDLDWSFVIQTKETNTLLEYYNLLEKHKKSIWIQPIITCGMEKDWISLERKQTTDPLTRLETLKDLKKEGFNVAVNGEPFIPGYHSLLEFRDFLNILKSMGIKRYNTYNFHFNDFVAKRLAEIGIDVCKIWEMNQDSKWKFIQLEMIELAKEFDVILGCPDFVNSKNYYQKCNTCCGIDVPNPTSYNTHEWKRRLLKGESIPSIIETTYDHIGDFKTGKSILNGTCKDFYTLKDCIYSPIPKIGLFK